MSLGSYYFQKTISLRPYPRGFHVITEEVLDAIPEIGNVKTGLLNIFLLHTSASLSINENADSDVRRDLENWINSTASEEYPFVHTAEGHDDMPAHVKSTLFGTSLTIPVSNGGLLLGTWQGIYLGEHRNQGGRRSLVLTLLGVPL